MCLILVFGGCPLSQPLRILGGGLRPSPLDLPANYGGPERARKNKKWNLSPKRPVSQTALRPDLAAISNTGQKQCCICVSTILCIRWKMPEASPRILRDFKSR